MVHVVNVRVVGPEALEYVGRRPRGFQGSVLGNPYGKATSGQIGVNCLETTVAMMERLLKGLDVAPLLAAITDAADAQPE